MASTGPALAACKVEVRDLPTGGGDITLFKLENGTAVPTGETLSIVDDKNGRIKVVSPIKVEDCGSTKYLRWRKPDGTAYLILQSEMTAVADCVCLAQRTDISGTPAAAPCGKCP